MRSNSLLVLAGLVVLSCGYIVLGRKLETIDTDTDYLYKEKVILDLLQHVHQNEVLLKLYGESKLWRLEDNYNFFTKVDSVKEFVKLYKTGLLPTNEIFTIYNEYHRNQAVSLFNVFYFAKDFDTFYKSVAWAFFEVNEGMFVYALTVAVLHRDDTRGIVLPAPYEICPYYFFNVETIQQAQNYKKDIKKGILSQ